MLSNILISSSQIQGLSFRASNMNETDVETGFGKLEKIDEENFDPERTNVVEVHKQHNAAGTGIENENFASVNNTLKTDDENTKASFNENVATEAEIKTEKMENGDDGKAHSNDNTVTETEIIAEKNENTETTSEDNIVTDTKSLPNENTNKEQVNEGEINDQNEAVL